MNHKSKLNVRSDTLKTSKDILQHILGDNLNMKKVP
jgi:hypothetical protein